MRLLLGMHNALVLWDDGKQIALHEGEGVYYGITWDGWDLFVVARGNQPTRMRRFAADMTSLSNEPPFQHLGPSGDGPHQAIWWNRVLYVTNTQRNRVECWDGREVFYLNWNETDDDYDHINSIWCNPDDGYFYVVEHRKTLRPKRIRMLAPDYVLYDTIELDLDCLADGPTHNGLHNIYIEDDVIFTLGPSQLVVYDLRNEKICEIPFSGIVKNKHYLRGLARTYENYFIGVSNARPRDQRGWGGSSILITDGFFRVVDVVNLHPRFGQLMEIRIVDEPDFAHNGIRCPLRGTDEIRTAVDLAA